MVVCLERGAASWGPLKKENNPGALGTCPVCPLDKMALITVISGHICFLLLVFSVFTLFSCRF